MRVQLVVTSRALHVCHTPYHTKGTHFTATHSIATHAITFRHCPIDLQVPKFSPWYFDSMLASSTEFELAESLGLNAVRLGFMWSGYNPAPGVFNATYMSVIKTIIGKFNDHGIHVLLDMHQVRSRTATRRARSRLSARRAASVCAHKPRMVLCVMFASCCVLNPFRALPVPHSHCFRNAGWTELQVLSLR